MSYSVKPGSGWGRIGEGLGKGLSEQFMPAFQQGRLAAGLRNLEETGKGLTPLQQFSRLAAIPGITPQMMQTYGELLQKEGLRQGYANIAGEGEPGAGAKDMQEPGQPITSREPASMQRRGTAPEGMVTGEGEKSITPGHLREASMPRQPWSQAKRARRLGELSKAMPGVSVDDLFKIVDEEEKRWLQAGEFERGTDEYLRNKQEEATDELDRQIKNKLQKTTLEDAFKELPGYTYEAMRRGLSNDIANNPDMPLAQIVDKWSTKALEIGRAGTQLDKLAKENRVIAGILGSKNYKEKLRAYGDIYRGAGMEEDYFNKLKSEFGLSPQAAASFAYPLTPKMREITQKKPKGKFNWETASRQRADEVVNALNPNESLLSIAHELKMKDPFFSENVFFEQMRNHMDKLTERQRREVAEGPQTGAAGQTFGLE